MPQEHILAQENGKERCLIADRELSQAFALFVPDKETPRIRDEAGFVQAVRAMLVKRVSFPLRPQEKLVRSVRQIISLADAKPWAGPFFCRDVGTNPPLPLYGAAQDSF